LKELHSIWLLSPTAIINATKKQYRYRGLFAKIKNSKIIYVIFYECKMEPDLATIPALTELHSTEI